MYNRQALPPSSQTALSTVDQRYWTPLTSLQRPRSTFTPTVLPRCARKLFYAVVVTKFKTVMARLWLTLAHPACATDRGR